MNVLNHFSVPYKGLGSGEHHLEFIVESDFFNAFEGSHITNGSFEIQVSLDKRYDHSILQFDINGTTKTSCDRCLADIDLPLIGNFELLVKHGEKEDSNDEIMFIHPETSILNLAQVIYEFILLSMPMIKVYDCHTEEKSPCNVQVLDKLEDEETQKSNQASVWDSLKNIDFKE